MDTQLLLSQLLNGLGNGLIYFLVAVGFTLAFGLMNFVNFAHGAFFLVGAYLAYEALAREVSFMVALAAVPLVAAGGTLVVEWLLFRRLYRQEHTYQIVATLALAILVQELVTLIWGPNTFTVNPPAGFTSAVELGPITYPTYRIFVVVVAAVLALALFLLLERTRLGAMLRAGSQDASMLACLGVNVNRLFSLTIALAAGLAALAGVLSTPMRSITPVTGTEVLALAVVVVVVGTLGSYTGTLIAALAVAEVQSVAIVYAPEYGNVVIYVLMAAVLLLRSEALLVRVGRLA